MWTSVTRDRPGECLSYMWYCPVRCQTPKDINNRNTKSSELISLNNWSPLENSCHSPNNSQMIHASLIPNFELVELTSGSSSLPDWLSPNPNSLCGARVTFPDWDLLGGTNPFFIHTSSGEKRRYSGLELETNYLLSVTDRHSMLRSLSGKDSTYRAESPWWDGTFSRNYEYTPSLNVLIKSLNMTDS